MHPSRILSLGSGHGSPRKACSRIGGRTRRASRYAAHRHDYNKVIVVTRGGIIFGLPEVGTSLPLEAGDRLDLPAGTLHDAVVGSRGVHCLEAHLEPGALGRRAERRAGWAAGEP